MDGWCYGCVQAGKLGRVQAVMVVVYRREHRCEHLCTHRDKYVWRLLWVQRWRTTGVRAVWELGRFTATRVTIDCFQLGFWEDISMAKFPCRSQSLILVWHIRRNVTFWRMWISGIKLHLVSTKSNLIYGDKER